MSIPQFKKKKKKMLKAEALSHILSSASDGRNLVGNSLKKQRSCQIY